MLTGASSGRDLSKCAEHEELAALTQEDCSASTQRTAGRRMNVNRRCTIRDTLEARHP